VEQVPISYVMGFTVYLPARVSSYAIEFALHTSSHVLHT